MAHEEVRTRLEASIKNMKTITDKFLSAIIVSVEKIPYVCHRCLLRPQLYTAGTVFPPKPSPARLTALCLSLRYGMRFISKVLKDTLHEKFPDATEDELLKV